MWLSDGLSCISVPDLFLWIHSVMLSRCRKMFYGTKI